MRARLVIDPLNLTEDTGRILSEYLSQKDQECYLSRKTHNFWLGKTRFRLAHDILVRKNRTGGWRYDVVADEHFAQGKFGSIYKIISTLKMSQADTLTSNNMSTKYAIKVQQASAEDEYKMMLRCPQFKATRFFKGMPSIIEMRQFQGKILNDVINEDRTGKRPLSVDERFRITIILLRSLQSQIHDHGIVHRDIKPDNIIYDLDNHKAYFIDLGISKYIVNTRDKRSRGNSSFSPPEEYTSQKTDCPVTVGEFLAKAAMYSNTDFASDVYSLARVIGLLWRDNDKIFLAKDGGYKERIVSRASKQWVDNPDMFHGINKKLPDDTKIKINSLIDSMIIVDKAGRPSLTRCIQAFEDIYFGYKISKQDQFIEEPDELVFAHKMGLVGYQGLRFIKLVDKLASDLNKIVSEIHFAMDDTVAHLKAHLNRRFYTKYALLAYDLDKVAKMHHFNDGMSVRNLKTLLEKISSIDHLEKTLMNLIHDLPDANQDVVAEFAQCLGVRAFMSCNTKKELIGVVESTTKTHYQLLDELENVFDREQIASILDKLNASPITFDRLVSDNKKLASKIEKHRQVHHDFNSKLPL